MLALKNVLRELRMGILPSKDYVKSKNKLNEQREKLAELNRAKNDWEFAQRFFNHATEPELIDYAIYAMEAAEKKYVYILKRLEKQEISPEIIFNMYFE